jgi:hypothetical protein
MKIKQAISSAILVLLVTAPTAWGQDNIRAAMESANKEWSAAYNSMNGKAFPALYTGRHLNAAGRASDQWLGSHRTILDRLAQGWKQEKFRHRNRQYPT